MPCMQSSGQKINKAHLAMYNNMSFDILSIENLILAVLEHYIACIFIVLFYMLIL